MSKVKLASFIILFLVIVSAIELASARENFLQKDKSKRKDPTTEEFDEFNEPKDGKNNLLSEDRHREGDKNKSAEEEEEQYGFNNNLTEKNEEKSNRKKKFFFKGKDRRYGKPEIDEETDDDEERKTKNRSLGGYGYYYYPYWYGGYGYGYYYPYYYDAYGRWIRGWY